jgi:succinate dehydrogenase/fumarate reductase cytochrome b subunit
MATAATPAPPPLLKGGVRPLRAGEGHSFFWRKMHSLSGIIPIGAFLIEHIISNFETWNGPLAYAQQVKFLNALPLVRVLEWVFIFIPIAFHGIYGLVIAFKGRVNVNVYPWAGNWGYLTQRITGIIAFFYIIQHVWRQRFSGVMLPEHPGRRLPRYSMSCRIPGCWRFMLSLWWRPAGTLLTASGYSPPNGASRPAIAPGSASAMSAVLLARRSASWVSSVSTPSSINIRTPQKT